MLAAAHQVPAMEEADAAAEITAHRDTWANSSGALEYQVLGGACVRASNLSVRGRYASTPVGSGKGFRQAHCCLSVPCLHLTENLAAGAETGGEDWQIIGEASEDEPGLL